ncbi:hypothetical protein D9M69_638570 [compost metagenome]
MRTIPDFLRIIYLNAGKFSEGLSDGLAASQLPHRVSTALDSDPVMLVKRVETICCLAVAIDKSAIHEMTDIVVQNID